MDLAEIINKLDALPDERRRELEQEVVQKSADRKFIPNAGPQLQAYRSHADVLLYGGEAGGGKSGLLCGLALEEHHQSLIMRRNGVDLEGGGGIIEEMLRLNGTRQGYSGKPPPTLKTGDGRIITFGAATNIGDEQKYQGRARDFLGVDEATQFHEDQIRFLMAWVRTTVEGQRTRTVFGTNPPVDKTGQWVVGFFRPWLDITHENPAKPGELRWFITVKEASGNTKDIEVDGPNPVEIGGDTLIPTSRTFIPAKLTDNPFIITTDYQKQLDALPEPYRSAIRDGNFMAALPDRADQVIPTDWIIQAQERWTSEPPAHAPMSCLAVDPAQGGQDSTVIATRHDAWFAELHETPGIETPTGNEVAGLVVATRRNGCTIVVDMGGGYGGSTKMRLEDSSIEVRSHKGANGTLKRTADLQFGFFNTRAMAYWRMREALDPAQDGGSNVSLPDDPQLLADLTTPRFSITSSGIKITSKQDVVKELGRSPDKGDAVTMCNLYGPKLMTHGNQWRDYAKTSGPTSGGPNVVQNRMAARKSIGRRR